MGTSDGATSRPSWGDLVRVLETAPAHIRRGFAAVCGFGTVDNEAAAQASGWPMGTRWVTIEFGDGTTIEVPDTYVELAERA